MMLQTFYRQALTRHYWLSAVPVRTFSTAQATVTSTSQKVVATQKSKPKKQATQQQKVLSTYEKMAEIDVDETTGVVTHKHLLSQDGQTRRTFPSVDVFHSWLGGQKRKMRQDLRQKLTPLQYYITQGKGNERPFTGEYWEKKDVGMYSCIVCTQRLFMFDHKFQNTSGYPTFWNGIKDAIKFEEDHLEIPEPTNAVLDPLLQFKSPVKRCKCSNCEAHLGHLFADGPAPLGLRFQINSAALNFHKKEWFQIPKLDRTQLRSVKLEKQKSLDGLKRYQELLDDEKALGLDNYLVRAKEEKEKQAALRADTEKQTLFDVKGQQQSKI